jgi:hypothetical protein
MISFHKHFLPKQTSSEIPRNLEIQYYFNKIILNLEKETSRLLEIIIFYHLVEPLIEALFELLYYKQELSVR